MSSRLVAGLLVSCIAVWIVLFMMVFIEYRKLKSEYEYIDFDLNSLTIAEYTVEFNISTRMWRTFLKYYYDCNNPITQIDQFKLYIR